MYMSTVVPADAQCYVTECHHCTPEYLFEQEDCITSVYFQSYTIQLGK